MLVLGIETSCDETSAAVVTGDRRILSNIVHSQTLAHQPFQGVVPEIAAREHIAHLDGIIHQALQQAGVTLAEISAIAATGGPGLIGGVLVGVMTAKAMAHATGKPFIAVNHLAGHALTVRLTHDVAFPYLLLLVSGGHCQILCVNGVGDYSRLGGTLDDALGECFDKVAKMLGLGYPGGPAVERMAQGGTPHAFVFPVPIAGRAGCDFSFSGLKTAVRDAVQRVTMDDVMRADICASFQHTVGVVLRDRLQHAVAMAPAMKTLVVAGGVAANHFLGGVLKEFAAAHGMELVVPPPALCTDNAAMIAWAGLEHFRLGQVNDLSFDPRARWPLASSPTTNTE